MRTESEKERNNGEAKAVGRCCRCGGEIYVGEAVYRLKGKYLCPECLPGAARCWLAGCLTVAADREEVNA